MSSQVYFEGMEENRSIIRSIPFLMRGAVEKALIVGGGMIVETAKNNIRANGSVVTGNLFQSVKMKKSTEDGDPVILVGTEANYAAAYEFGMAVNEGDFDSPEFADRMMEWGAMKGLDEDETRAIIAHIRKNGTRPHPFLYPALEEHQDKIGELIERAVDKEAQSVSGN